MAVPVAAALPFPPPQNKQKQLQPVARFVWAFYFSLGCGLRQVFECHKLVNDTVFIERRSPLFFRRYSNASNKVVIENEKRFQSDLFAPAYKKPVAVPDKSNSFPPFF